MGDLFNSREEAISKKGRLARIGQEFADNMIVELLYNSLVESMSYNNKTVQKLIGDKNQ